MKLDHAAVISAQVSLEASGYDEWQADAGGRGCNKRPERLSLREVHCRMLGQDASFGVALHAMAWA